MIRRRQLRNIWLGILIVFVIVSFAYSNHSSLISLSPENSNVDFGRILFAGFVVLLLLVLLVVIVIPYLIHELEN